MVGRLVSFGENPFSGAFWLVSGRVFSSITLLIIVVFIFVVKKSWEVFGHVLLFFWGLQTETLSNVLVAWRQQASKRSDSSSDEKRTLKLKKGETGDEKRYPMGSMFGIFTYMKTIKINQM